ncbi:MAG: uroporphyrinogen-III synthase [Mariprofundales bacterium]
MKTPNLKNKRILITRAQENYAKTAQLVSQYGGIPLVFPCMQRIDDLVTVQAALNSLRHFNTNTHILLTSVAAVEVLALASKMSLLAYLDGIPLVVIGNKTAAAAQKHGLQVAVKPDNPAQFSQCFLFEKWQKYGLPQQVVFFRAAFGRNLIVEQLQTAGVQVSVIAAYSMCCPADSINNNADIIRNQLQLRAIDAVLLGSSRTATHYCQRIGLPAANQAILCAISQKVADDAGRLGLNVVTVAKESSFAAMLAALCIYFDNLLKE